MGQYRLHLCSGATHFNLDNERLTFTGFFGDFGLRVFTDCIAYSDSFILGNRLFVLL